MSNIETVITAFLDILTLDQMQKVHQLTSERLKFMDEADAIRLRLKDKFVKMHDLGTSKHRVHHNLRDAGGIFSNFECSARSWKKLIEREGLPRFHRMYSDNAEEYYFYFDNQLKEFIWANRDPLRSNKFPDLMIVLEADPHDGNDDVLYSLQFRTPATGYLHMDNVSW